MLGLSDAQISEVIEMALCDDTAFTSIEAIYGLDESSVKRVMQENLKAGSYRAWRKRVRTFRDRRAIYKGWWRKLNGPGELGGEKLTWSIKTTTSP